MNKDNKTITRRLEGVVTSDKQDKTLTVLVGIVKIHSKYKKRYTISRKYKVHDEKNQYKEGDKVIFEQCRPLSKEKTWRVLYK